MTIKYKDLRTLQPGTVLYDRHRQKLGNTSFSEIGEWQVRIIELTSDGALVSWNNNKAEPYSFNRLRKLYTWSMHDPGVEVTKNILGGVTSVKKSAKKDG